MTNFHRNAQMSHVLTTIHKLIVEAMNATIAINEFLENGQRNYIAVGHKGISHALSPSRNSIKVYQKRREKEFNDVQPGDAHAESAFMNKAVRVNWKSKVKNIKKKQQCANKLKSWTKVIRMIIEIVKIK